MTNSKPSVIVVGCGTFGMSTIYHLASQGYRRVTGLDRFPVPSPSSAAYDLNKVVRTEYREPIYTRLAQEAILLWHQPPFDSKFHETGWIMTTSDRSPSGESAFDEIVNNTKKYADASRLIDLPDEAAIKSRCPLLKDGTLKGWRGIWNANAGWIESKGALEMLGKKCKEMGVSFADGPMATFKNVVYEDGKAVGVICEDGTEWRADKIILALGGWSDVFFDFQRQTEACSYTITHYHLNQEEHERYKDLPVLDTDTGYLFPPTEDGVMKVCDHHLGHSNWTQIPGRDRKVSVPRDHALHPSDDLPDVDKKQTRSFVKTLFPELEHKEFFDSRMCWDTESLDLHWIIGPHPSSPTSLFLATSGSGHTAKNLPNVGKYVVQVMEGKLSEEHQKAWSWRPEKVPEEPSRRKDIKELPGWNRVNKVNE